MTTVLLLAPAALSLLVLGAHFLRADVPPLVVAALALIGLLAVRRRWAARVVQAALVLGALEWVRTLVVLTGERMREGLPYARMAGILGVVALVCAASAMAFRSVSVRRWFRCEARPREPSATG